jgi:RNA polymerase-binding transcription factor
MKKTTTSTRRTAQLRALLEDRRRQLTAGVTDLMRDVRARSENTRAADGQDGVDGEHRDDLDLALLQMRGETLARIDAALRRLEAGTYGICGDCNQPIASERLRALPFAARCRPCEETREAAATPRKSAAAKAYTYHAIE